LLVLVTFTLTRVVPSGPMESGYWNNVLWSPSYFAASCGGAPLGIIKQYVEEQKTPL
jgi:REP element-mobilizing transposase RayT